MLKVALGPFPHLYTQEGGSFCVASRLRQGTWILSLMLICNLKIVYIDSYILQHFLCKAFTFLVIGKSPSFLRFHSQTISEIGGKKKKKTLTGSHMQERDSDNVWKESHFYFLHLFHYSKGVNFNWHFPRKKIILGGGGEMEAITHQKYVEGFHVKGKYLLFFKYFQPRRFLAPD